MENNPQDSYTCPSFSSYSNTTLAEIAIRAVAGSSNNDEEFQFALAREDGEEEFSCGGGNGNGNVLPLFDRNLLLNEFSGETKRPESSSVPILEKLCDGDDQSCSSSEADELENIPAGTYCVWRPKEANRPPLSRGCEKSSSTGSIYKRWKFCDRLRSSSERKGNTVFLSQKNREERLPVGRRKGSVSPHEALYVLKRAMEEGNKKKSYLPYKRDLLGLFGNVNGF